MAILFCHLFFCIKKSELVAFFFGGYFPTAPFFIRSNLLSSFGLIVYLLQAEAAAPYLAYPVDYHKGVRIYRRDELIEL